MKKNITKKYAKADKKINKGWVDPTCTPMSLTKGL